MAKKKAASRGPRKAAKKKSAAKKSPRKAAKKSAAKKAPRKAAKKSAAKAPRKSGGKNKLGVKNSLVNNINARKKKGKSRPKSKSTISKKSYGDMRDNWGKD